VLVAFTDMQGGCRASGCTPSTSPTRARARHEGCNYLLAVDIDMNTVDGYAISSWERGYGDFEFQLDTRTIRLLPHQPGAAMVQCDLVWLDHSPVRQSPRTILQTQLDRVAERGLVALAGTELEFIAFHTSYEDAARQHYHDLVPVNAYNVDYSILGGAGPSRCCGRSATPCTRPGWTSSQPRGSATSASTRSASCTPTP
jgi:glutamine synthetase